MIRSYWHKFLNNSDPFVIGIKLWYNTDKYIVINVNLSWTIRKNISKNNIVLLLTDISHFLFVIMYYIFCLISQLED